jgi:Fe(3+) dicitrate transport protein
MLSLKQLPVLFFLLFAINEQSQAQKTTAKDSLTTGSYLPNITVVGRNSKSDIHQLPEIVGTNINAGKKNALIVMDNVNGNVVTNNMRQVMAKIPGIQIWESDGSGVQIGIAARGLSPNRSWEFNVRQNGYDISADPFGYPEAYYNPQLQAVQRIEVIRGHGALQYGPQFGGMVNYVLRNGSEINKPFQFESQQTIGSYGMFNSYNAIGGETKKSHYYVFVDHRNAEGWRQNSRYYTNNGYATYTYKINNKLHITTELVHAQQRMQQPGGLTDAEFNNNARQSHRARNWFDIKWTTAAVIANYNINSHSSLNIKTFAILGNRNSVGFIRPVNVKDSINTATMDYNNRTLDIDHYRNYGVEARYITNYNIGKIKSTLSAGVRLYQGNTYRWRDGVANTGADYSGVTINGVWPKAINYQSQNVAAFAENALRLGKLLIVPGLRMEYVDGKAGGRNGYKPDGSEILLQNQRRSRSFLLAGVGVEYHTGSKTELYGNITQAYRPIQFADLTAPPTTDVIDPNLTDAKGFNADLGYRGKIKNWLFFDASIFYMQYNNRVGTITQQNTDGTFYNLRTNTGASTSKGIEAIAEISLLDALKIKAGVHSLSAFASYSYAQARYNNFRVVVKNGNQLVETNLKDKRVENAPENIIRTGISYGYKGLMVTTQLSHVSSAFSDANNTITPTANGQTGLIPAYTVLDITATYRWSKQFNIKSGINNLTNQMYFTRRAGGYPGPGVLPAEPRTFFVSFGVTL